MPVSALCAGDSPSQTSKTHRGRAAGTGMPKPLFVRGNLFSDSVHWLKRSYRVFSAVKQWLLPGDGNRDMQKRLGGIGEPGRCPLPGRSWWSLGQPQPVQLQVQAPLPTVLLHPPGPQEIIFPTSFLSPLPPPQNPPLLPAATAPWPRLSTEPGVPVVEFHPLWCMKELTC